MLSFERLIGYCAAGEVEQALCRNAVLRIIFDAPAFLNYPMGGNYTFSILTHSVGGQGQMSRLERDRGKIAFSHGDTENTKEMPFFVFLCVLCVSV